MVPTSGKCFCQVTRGGEIELAGQQHQETPAPGSFFQLRWPVDQQLEVSRL